MPCQNMGEEATVLGPESVEQIAKLLDERFGLDALWVFGSVASNAATATSDIDLAALFARRPALAELLEARADLERVLGRDVDLVDLERASPILAMQVLRHGRLLRDGNPSRRHRFVAGAPGRYEDLRIIRRKAEAALLDRVRSGRS